MLKNIIKNIRHRLTPQLNFVHNGMYWLTIVCTKKIVISPNCTESTTIEINKTNITQSKQRYRYIHHYVAFRSSVYQIQF